MTDVKKTRTRAERTAALRKRATAASIGLLAGAFAMVAISTQQTGQAATVSTAASQPQTTGALAQNLTGSVPTASAQPAVATTAPSATNATNATTEPATTGQTVADPATVSLVAAASQAATAQSASTSKATQSAATQAAATQATTSAKTSSHATTKQS